MKNREWGISKLKNIKLKTNRKSTKSINYGMTVYFVPEKLELCIVQVTFEHGHLDTLSIIQTDFCNMTKALASFGRNC